MTKKVVLHLHSKYKTNLSIRYTQKPTPKTTSTPISSPKPKPKNLDQSKQSGGAEQTSGGDCPEFRLPKLQTGKKRRQQDTDTVTRFAGKMSVDFILPNRNKIQTIAYASASKKYVAGGSGSATQSHLCLGPLREKQLLPACKCDRVFVHCLTGK